MSHPLLQALCREPKLHSPDRPLLVLLPPPWSLPAQVDFDHLASHVVQLPINMRSRDAILGPQPTPSLSASAVFSRIKSPRSSPANRNGSRQRPRAQSSSHVDPKGAPLDEIILHTMNGRTLRARHNVIKAGQGFAAFMEAKVMREDLLHAGNHVSHILLHLDQPLLRKGTPEPMTLNDATVSRFHGIDLGLFIRSFCDAAVAYDDLNDLHEHTEEFLLEGYTMLNEVTQDDDTYTAFESFLMEQTYDVLFFKISQLELLRDQELTHAFERLKHIDFNQVGLPPTITDGPTRVRRGIAILQRIGTYRTPAEKIDCLLDTISQLSQSCHDEAMSPVESEGKEDGMTGDLNSDALVPLLLLTFIRSQVPHLMANLTYMKRFTFRQDVTMGRSGFALSTFESILQYTLQFVDTLAEISDLNQALWAAVEDNDLETVQRLSETEHDDLRSGSLTPKAMLHTPRDTRTMCHASDRQGNNIVLIACRSGHVNIIDYLLQHHAIGDQDVNTRGETPLMRAVQSGSVKATALLLRNPHVLQSLDAVDVDGNTAALIACTRPQLILEQLLQQGASLCVQNHAGDGPLHAVCENGSVDQILWLLDRVPPHELGRPNAQGKTFFHVCPYTSVLERYLTHKALDTPDCRGRSPLLLWASQGRVDMVQLLVSPSAVVDRCRVDQDGRSVLHHLANVLRLRVLSLRHQHSLWLITEKVKDMVNVRDRLDRSTALHLVATTVITANLATAALFVKYLVDAGADLNARNRYGERALHVCRTPSLTSALQGLYIDGMNDGDAWAVTRAELDVQAQTVYYVMCSRTKGDGVRETRRTFQDFLFLQKEIRYESPESFLPSLDGVLDPLDVDLCPPPLCILEDTVARLDSFMSWLRQHPVLQKSETVQMFVRASELRKAVIQDGTFARRTLVMERICEKYPSATDVESDDLYFFTYAHGIVVPLRDALFKVLCAARAMDLCRRTMEEQAMSVIQGFESSQCLSAVDLEAIKVCASLACDTMHVPPLTPCVNTLQSMHELSNGILMALQRPFSLFNQRTALRDQLERQREAARRATLPWSGLFTTLDQRAHGHHDKGEVIKTLQDMERTGSQINQSHQMIADELAHFQSNHPSEMRRMLRRLAHEQLTAERLKLCWLEQTWSGWKREATAVPGAEQENSPERHGVKKKSWGRDGERRLA